MKIKLDQGAFMPEYAHEQDAGMDLRSPINRAVRPIDENELLGIERLLDTD